MEENLFPSQRAIETPDGMEEERRLFYVALTRAKVSATLSYAESRFKWGNMEFSRPSTFLKEIDPLYVEFAAEEEEFMPRRSAASPSRYGGQVGHREGPSPQGRKSESEAIQELRRRFDYRFKREAEERSRQQGPRPELVSPEHPKVEHLRRVESRPTAGATAQPCAYRVGERVRHPLFGEGEIERIEAMAQDHKLVVRFQSGSEKTLLAKFAKLTKC